MILVKLITLIALTLLFSEKVLSEPLVTTSLGIIEGTRQNCSGLLYDQFLGIRYGHIPKRFQYSQVANQPWSGVYKAIKFGSACVQLFSNGTSEDCLFANVWRPIKDDDTSKLLPVLLWVHGSGYQFGSAEKNPGEILAAMGKIMVVTVNYRLGAFGYAYGEENEIQGNQGLSDVITALHWTRDNIVHFGGDPNRVTLAGHSAGSMMGSIFPTITSIDQSLYSRLWLMSGVSVNAMFIEDTAIATSKLQMLAAKVGCANTPESPITVQMIKCLQKVNSSLLISRNQDDDIKALGGAEVAAFMPVYGTKLISKPLIEQFWAQYNTTQKKTIVIAIHKDESASFWGYLKPKTRDEAWFMVWEKLSFIKKDLTPSEMEPIFNYYFSGTRDNDTRSLRTSLTNFMNDYSFRCNSLTLAQVYSTYHSVRFAEFNYILDGLGPEARPDGPWHGDSIQLYFGRPFKCNISESSVFNPEFPSYYSDRDKEMSKNLIKSLADYVSEDELSLQDWPELHYNRKNSHQLPVIRQIDFTNTNIELDKQFICSKWSELLNF